MTDVFRLPKALAAWGTADFITTLKREVEVHSAVRAALARSMNRFGVIDEPITVMVLGADEQGEIVEARITILYTVTETVYSCPDCSAEDVVHGACEMTVLIDKGTAVTTFLFHLEDTTYQA
ncbi:MAG: hypothetical protein Q8K57_10255 [Thiobacillus sp.]|nr:hypothetical protein [Thiobacillus sp.]